MKYDLGAIRSAFRAGQRDKAIAEGEALCLQHPDNLEIHQLCATMHIVAQAFDRALPHLQEICGRQPANADAQFNKGLCLRELNEVAAALAQFELYTSKFPAHPDGWACLAECRFRTGDFGNAIAASARAVQLDAASVPAWTIQAKSQLASGRGEEALASLDVATRLAPQLAELQALRADALQSLGRMPQAADAYKQAVKLAPHDDATLKKATSCLLELDRGSEAVDLCNAVLKVHPSSVTARLGAEWLLGQMVPLWHVPMLNEDERNRPYEEALKAAVKPDDLVFEIGAGSGLLAMMAARAGAKQVMTCEAVGIVARTAKKIVERNGFAKSVTVLAKPSYQVNVGEDLPRPADVLVHEIFSSELLGEHVLASLEDAKARLLKPGGRVLPAKAGIMVALVGGEELARELHVGEVSGFDMSLFNDITPRKRPIHREDLPRVLFSDDVEAFTFDFEGQSTFAPERKRIDIAATRDGTCHGVIQWIRFEFAPGNVFENHPSRARALASWQHTIYRFAQPMELKKGDVVTLDAMHDRTRPWFERAGSGATG